MKTHSNNAKSTNIIGLTLIALVLGLFIFSYINIETIKTNPCELCEENGNICEGLEYNQVKAAVDDYIGGEDDAKSFYENGIPG